MNINTSPLSPPGGNGAKGAANSGFVLRRLGQINPDSIDDYLKAGGYVALKRAVMELGAGAALETISRAGLRGRGGAGFDTAHKWRAAIESPAAERYVVANAFGADPAAFGDRTLLESDPHAVLEGTAIAAFAVGASRAFIYCCLDHALAVQRITRAVRQAEERGFLGSGILGSGFSCHVSVVPAPFGFAAGEETAAIALIEGKRPMPAARPPYPAEAGLWGKPTVVNNAETLANVTGIVEGLPFAALGTPESRGTKLVTIGGRVNKPGVVEVPFGVSVGQIIGDAAGGLRAGHELKAVQIGGPTGALLPASLLDVKLDFASLEAAGGILGSGSLFVLDQNACVVDFVRGQLQLLSAESCGRCVPGRLGTARLAFVLDQIAAGLGRPGDLEILAELADNMADGAVCGYGITARNPVRSALQHFRDEFEAHIADKRCPAGRCAVSAGDTPHQPGETSEKRQELWRRIWPIRR